MAYHPSAFCHRRRQAAVFFVSIGLAVSLLIVPWFASSASGVSPSPTTSVLVPSNGASLSGTAATLDAAASNATSVKFLLFGGSYGYAAPVICTATPSYYGWVCSWNTTTVPDGSYGLVSEASRSPGGTAYSSGVGITVDNPPPTTSIVVPSNGASLSGTAYLGRRRIERHQRQVPALRGQLRLCRAGDLHGHAELLRMGVQLEHHDGTGRFLRPRI